MRKIKQLTTELTFRCNAKCPACHRLRIKKINLNEPKYTYTLESFKKLFSPNLLNNLEWLILNGNFGDSIMNKNFREIALCWRLSSPRNNDFSNFASFLRKSI